MPSNPVAILPPGSVEVLRSRPALIILDGFERQLVAYGSSATVSEDDEGRAIPDRDTRCSNSFLSWLLHRIVADQSTSRFLLTSRIVPRELRGPDRLPLVGCRELSLSGLKEGEAIQFLRSQGIRGTREALVSEIEPYGGHPLALRVLSGVIRNDPQKPGLAATRKHQSVTRDLRQQTRHVLARALELLSSDERRILGALAAFRDVIPRAAIPIALPDLDSHAVGAALNRLAQFYLILPDSEVLDMHPIVREFASTHNADRTVHTRLRQYYSTFPRPH